MAALGMPLPDWTSVMPSASLLKCTFMAALCVCAVQTYVALQHSCGVHAGHQSDVDVVRWHPNSHYVATGSSDRSIRLWDIRDGSVARVFVGHQSTVCRHCLSLAICS